MDQPFAVGRVFGGEGNRGLGLEASWLSPLPWYLELVGSVTDASGEGTARSFLGGSDHGVTSPLDFQFTGAVKQFFPLSDDVSLLWGLSAAEGPNAEGAHTRTGVYGTDVYLKFRPLSAGSITLVTLQAELFYRRRQLTDNVLSDVNGYGQVLWRFDQRWAAAGRYEFGSPARGLDGAIAFDELDNAQLREVVADREARISPAQISPAGISQPGRGDLGVLAHHPSRHPARAARWPKSVSSAPYPV